MSGALKVADDRATRGNNAKGAQTRMRLLEAAKDAFETKGYEATNIGDLTERAALSHGSFYHYFGSKEAIFTELVRVLDEQFREPLSAIIFEPGSTLPAAERIGRGIRSHLQTYRREASFLRVIDEYAGKDDAFAAARYSRGQRQTERVVRSIQLLQERGEADPDVDATVAVPALSAMVNGLAEAWLIQGRLTLTLDEAVDQLTALWANALGLMR